MIDENDAPEGYKAVRAYGLGCSDCAFVTTDELGLVLTDCPAQSCAASERGDGCSVIFTKRDPA